MEKRAFVRILLAAGSAAALTSAPALAQTGVNFPSGQFTPSVFNEWTQFFDAVTSVAQARVRLLHSIKGSNRAQVNKWLNQWLRGLLDDDLFADGSDEDGRSGKQHPGVPSGQLKDGKDNSVTISGSSFELVPPGGGSSFVTQWPNPNEGSDQTLTAEANTPVTVNPEPATFLLLAPGFATAGLLLRRRRRHPVDD